MTDRLETPGTGLPAPATVTETYLAALLGEMMALNDQLAALIAAIQDAAKPAPAQRKARTREQMAAEKRT